MTSSRRQDDEVVLLAESGARAVFGRVMRRTPRRGRIWFGTTELGQVHWIFDPHGQALKGALPDSAEPSLLMTRDAYDALNCLCSLLCLLKGESVSWGEVNTETGETPVIRFEGVAA